MRKPWQYTLLGAAIAFFVLYGIELSTDGMKDVYGPLEPRKVERAGSGSGNGLDNRESPHPASTRGESASPRQEPYDEWPGGAHGESGTGGAPERGDDGAWPELNGGYDGYGYPYDGAAAGGGAVSRLADGTAGLLQSMAKGGIRFIVSLFESLTQ